MKKKTKKLYFTMIVGNFFILAIKTLLITKLDKTRYCNIMQTGSVFLVQKYLKKNLTFNLLYLKFYFCLF